MGRNGIISDFEQGNSVSAWLNPGDYRPDDTAADVDERLRHLLDDLGLDYYSYIILEPPRDAPFDITRTFRTNYPSEWTSHYMSHRYYQLDPVAETTRREFRPFFWNHGRYLRRFRKRQRGVFNEAREFRIMNGLSIPLRGRHGELASFNVVAENQDRLLEATHGQQERLYAALYDTHDRILGEQMACHRAAAMESVHLSLRECECLIWTLEGKTAGEIATILGLSVSTVNHYASSATHKLGSSNKYHAAVRALRNGLIA